MIEKLIGILSPDFQRTAEGGLSIYEVKIEPNGETLMVEGKERYLEAGMSVTCLDKSR